MRAFDDLLHAALVRLCGDRVELLAHAVRASSPREPLRPLGSLCGPTAFDHAHLAGALYRLQPAGTGLTRAVLRRRHPVWIPALDAESAFARRALLSHYRIKSGAGFPIVVDGGVAAVIELLSFGELLPQPSITATVHDIAAELRVAATANAARIESPTPR